MDPRRLLLAALALAILLSAGCVGSGQETSSPASNASTDHPANNGSLVENETNASFVESGRFEETFTGIHVEIEEPRYTRTQEKLGTNCIAVEALPEETRVWVNMTLSFAAAGTAEQLHVQVDAVQPDNWSIVHRASYASPAELELGPFVAGTGAEEGDPAILVRFLPPSPGASRYEVSTDWTLTLTEPDPHVVEASCT